VSANTHMIQQTSNVSVFIRTLIIDDSML